MIKGLVWLIEMLGVVRSTMFRLSDDGRSKIHLMNVKKAIRVVGLAKRRCVVDTGRLRSSITLRDSEGVIATGGFEDGLSVPIRRYSVRVGTNVFYGKFIEFGTVNMSAKPFLRPSIDEVF